MRRSFIGIAVVLVLVAVGWMLISKRTADRTEAARSGASDATIAAQSTSPSSQPGSPGTATVHTMPTPVARSSSSTASAAAPTDFARRFQAATDYRELLDELSQSSSAEAPYFIARILTRCADVSRYGFNEIVTRFGIETASGPAETLNARMEAFRKMKQPCAGLEGRRFSADQISGKRREGIDRADPRSLAQALGAGEVEAGTDPIALAASLLERNDPLILNELSTYLAGAGHGVRMIGGQPLDPGDFRAAEFAWKMMSCDFGFDCGPDSDLVREGCAYSAICGMGSYEDLIRNGFARDEREYRRALEFRAKILDALRRKDYASLGLIIRR